MLLRQSHVVNILKDDRALSILPLSHMFELTIEIAILHVGASVVYARTLSPDTLLKLFASQGVTCMVMVPQALQLFLNGIEREVRQTKERKTMGAASWYRGAPPVSFPVCALRSSA